AHRAEDITQEVFVKLARHAGDLIEHPALLGWLHTTTRCAAIDVIRSEQQRKCREEAAHAMHANETAGDVNWERLRPVLDESLSELSEPDREVVLARYFDGQPFMRIAGELGISENAAQKRTDRALDKLHAALTRRHITSTSAALGTALATNASMAAPGWLAASAAKAALAGSVIGTATASSGLLTFMTTGKLGIGIAGALAVVGLGAAYLNGKTAHETTAALALSLQQEAALTDRLRDLEKASRISSERERVADEKTGQLLSTAKAMMAAKQNAAVSTETERLTSEIVNRRFKLAQQLVDSGDPETALRELVWCYDVGMLRVAGMSYVRTTAVGLFAKLGERYAPALAALRERRDQVRVVMDAEERDVDATKEFASINSALKNESENIAYFDGLPVGDLRRTLLAYASRDYLIENRRYADALNGKPYRLMSMFFESLVAGASHQPGTNESPALREKARAAVAISTAKDIETLAGVGDLAHARELAERLTAFDSSPATKLLIEKHVTRAGHPSLLAPATSP
ncbi:MAG: RNA polymerase sigma factor, partial [Opitutaceae bacterium]